jgi:hypothetical protein
MYEGARWLEEVVSLRWQAFCLHGGAPLVSDRISHIIPSVKISKALERERESLLADAGDEKKKVFCRIRTFELEARRALDVHTARQL